MIELLALFLSKPTYSRFYPKIKDHTLTKEAQVILKDFGEYYNNNPEINAIDVNQFRIWFTVLKHNSFKPETLTIYNKLFDNLLTHTTSGKPTALQDELLEHFIQRDYATRIADVSLNVAEGNDSRSILECEALLDEYKLESKRAKDSESEAISDDIDQLYTTCGTGLEWRLKCLNLALGPLALGNFIVLGKCPEVGGTAFVISEATHMLPQIAEDQQILYFGNEEHGSAIKQRVVSSVVGRNTAYVKDNIVSCAKEFTALRGADIKIFPIHGKNIAQIEHITKQFNPALIIVDQLWKVAGYEKSGNDVARITKVFAKAREIAATYAPVIAVHQADATGYGTNYLGMGQLYMSKIGIQGEADAIVTVGSSDEPGFENVRYLNIPKNKLPGCADETYRHSRHEVKIITELSRYAD